jgi:4-amino-4-deoxy-L-arabinose transferase-like glycosyltransferase
VNTDSALTQKEIPRNTVIKLFAAMAVVAFVLRIFYAGHLFQDDGLWFTAGEELLRGKALYREIYFDKPPVLPLLYALLFKLFGAHILTIRLFTILYSLAVGFTLYRFAAFLYNRRIGLLAAAMFVFFSTTYLTGHFQGLNTDFLMTLPYTLSAYWFARSWFDTGAAKARPMTFALAAGIAAGVAFQTNPKALFNLLFFALCSLAVVGSRRSAVGSKKGPLSEEQLQAPVDSDLSPSDYQPPVTGQRLPTTVYHLVLTGAGFLLGALPFWLYLAATGSLNEYRFSVWQWGAKYAAYFSLSDTVLTALRQSVGYFALNNVLVVGLLFVIVSLFKHLRRQRLENTKQASLAGLASQGFFRADAMLLLWFVTSYAAMSVGGRFFGHYFFQILPGLCLIAGRGIAGIFGALALHKPKRRLLSYVVMSLLAAGLLLTFVRFHARTAILAWDWARGAKSEWTVKWNHEKLNREERLVAAVIKDLPEDFQAIEKLGIEGLRARDTQKREAEGGDDYLFIWGYRPEIYYWSGLLPASRFLSSQPLTGVPSDVHYFGESYLSVLDEATTANYRQQLLGDLQATRPIYIVDELGFFNDQLALKNYPELKEFLADYKLTQSVGRSLIYYRPKAKEKNKNRDAAAE